MLQLRTVPGTLSTIARSLIPGERRRRVLARIDRFGSSRVARPMSAVRSEFDDAIEEAPAA